MRAQTLSTSLSYMPRTPTYQSPKTYGSATNRNNTPSTSDAAYNCHLCNFSTNRLNIIVLHNKTHSADKVLETTGIIDHIFWPTFW